MQLAPASRFASPFTSVQHWDDAFLALWPHRYDYLWAEHPNPSDRPEWKTESRHPLSDRLLVQGAYLYGVRFGSMTRYVVLDLDRYSRYHPNCDRFAWKRMVATLESLGLVQAVCCISSYSGGLHIYLPFEQEQKTWAIALVVTTLLENAGFKLAPGQLEVFPNCKPYAAGSEYSRYNGHRLPMQAGSYLLNQELEPIWGNQATFVQHWQFAQSRNSIDAKTSDRILKAARRQTYRITGKADKFLNDLNAEIELGWTGNGQTNRLLGRIAMRSYVFGHIYKTDTPLTGAALVKDIVNTARGLPGYNEWCGHQPDIENRAQEWATCVEQSHYFPYGTKPNRKADSTRSQSGEPSHNKKTRLSARERICKAVADLLEKASFPTAITKRFEALITYKISGQTLYKHQDLWHPDHLQDDSHQRPPEEPPKEPPKEPPEEPQSQLDNDPQECQKLPETLQTEIFCPQQQEIGGDRWEASPPIKPTNLLVEKGCNSLLGEGSSLKEPNIFPYSGCNSFAGEGLSHSEPRTMTTAEGIAHIRQVLEQIKARRREEQNRKRERWEGRSPFPMPSDNAPIRLPP